MAAYGPNVATLRYFNVAGVDIQGRSGECQPVAPHPSKIAAGIAVGACDGTCVRDYAYIPDLAVAPRRPGASPIP